MLSQKIYMLRKNNKLSQKQLAEKLDVSRQEISKWESGTSIPKNDKLELLSEYFNVSVDFLVKDQTDIEQTAADDPQKTISLSKSDVIGPVIGVVAVICLVLWGAISVRFPGIGNEEKALSSFLRPFFAREVDCDNGLKLFGTAHLLISAFFLLIYTFAVIFREKLQKFGHFKMIRRVMALILFSNMVIHYTGRIIIGEWHFGEDIPLHICFVTNFFMMYVLWTDNKHSLFSVIYYFTMIGPLPAIIFPDLSRSWSGYLFWQFLISHHIMLLFSIYCVFVLEYKTSLKSAICAFICGNIYVVLIKLFNLIFETNYLMLGELPQQLYDLFPFLNALPAFFWLEVVGIIALTAAYVLWGAITKRKTIDRSS